MKYEKWEYESDIYIYIYMKMIYEKYMKDDICRDSEWDMILKNHEDMNFKYHSKDMMII
jgi:hypothetical protein